MALDSKRMISIEISQETYSRLQQKAVPFKDSPETVIARLLNEGERNMTDPRPPTPDLGLDGSPSKLGSEVVSADITIKNPFDPPSLKHTKVLRAEVDGRQISKANWANVRQSLVDIALRQQGYSLRQLLEVCPINAQEGKKADEGYTHYKDLGVSIQGQDSNHTWQAAAALARALGLSVKVWFQWRTKPDARYPGKRSLLAIDQLKH